MGASEFAKIFSVCPCEADFAVRTVPALVRSKRRGFLSAIDPQGAVRKSGKGVFCGYRASPEVRFFRRFALPLDKIRAWSILKKRGTNVGRIAPPHARKITEKRGKQEKAKSEEKELDRIS